MILSMTYTQLVKKYGNANRAAKILGFSRQALSRWKTGGIPFESQYRIQQKTRGRLRADPSSLDSRKAA
jgi:hypothetical protein